MPMHHVAVSLRYARRHPEIFVYTDGHEHEKMAEQDALDYIEECRAKGYEVIPPCNNIKPDGTCAGHKGVIEHAKNS